MAQDVDPDLKREVDAIVRDPSLSENEKVQRLVEMRDALPEDTPQYAPRMFVYGRILRLRRIQDSAQERLARHFAWSPDDLTVEDADGNSENMRDFLERKRGERFVYIEGDLGIVEPGGLDGLISTAVQRASTVLNDRLDPGKELKERDLQAAFINACIDRLSERALEGVVSTKSVRWLDWPGVGPIDVVVAISNPPLTAFVELQWGRGTMFNCVWDVLKMALARRLDECSAAYLVAGAPLQEWQVLGYSEIFSSQRWSAEELLETHRPLFLKWAKDVETRPVHLPATFETRPVMYQDLSIGAEDWRLCCVGVAEPSSDMVKVAIYDA